MPRRWYIRTSSGKRGPFSSKDLRQLARDGTLKPNMGVSKNEGDSWTKAKKIDGLFPESKQSDDRVAKAKRRIKKQRGDDKWFVLTKHDVVGPLSARRLRKLARRGKLLPDVAVTQDGEKWVKAKRVKGLEFRDKNKNILDLDSAFDPLESEVESEARLDIEMQDEPSVKQEPAFADHNETTLASVDEDFEAVSIEELEDDEVDLGNELIDPDGSSDDGEPPAEDLMAFVGDQLFADDPPSQRSTSIGRADEEKEREEIDVPAESEELDALLDKLRGKSRAEAFRQKDDYYDLDRQEEKVASSKSVERVEQTEDEFDDFLDEILEDSSQDEPMALAAPDESRNGSRGAQQFAIEDEDSDDSVIEVDGDGGDDDLDVFMDEILEDSGEKDSQNSFEDDDDDEFKFEDQSDELDDLLQDLADDPLDEQMSLEEEDVCEQTSVTPVEDSEAESETSEPHVSVGPSENSEIESVSEEAEVKFDVETLPLVIESHPPTEEDLDPEAAEEIRQAKAAWLWDDTRPLEVETPDESPDHFSVNPQPVPSDVDQPEVPEPFIKPPSPAENEMSVKPAFAATDEDIQLVAEPVTTQTLGPEDWEVIREREYLRRFGQCTQKAHTNKFGQDICVYVFPPNQSRPVTTLVTSGLSNHPMQVPSDTLWSPRAELILYVNQLQSSHISILCHLAQIPLTRGVTLHYGKLLPNGVPPQPILGNADLDGYVMLIPPVKSDFGFQSDVKIDGQPLQLLWPVPTSAAERELLLCHGQGAFCALLDQNDHSITIDSPRSCYVQQSRANATANIGQELSVE